MQSRSNVSSLSAKDISVHPVSHQLTAVIQHAFHLLLAPVTPRHIKHTLHMLHADLGLGGPMQLGCPEAVTYETKSPSTYNLGTNLRWSTNTMKQIRRDTTSAQLCWSSNNCQTEQHKFNAHIAIYLTTVTAFADMFVVLRHAQVPES